MTGYAIVADAAGPEQIRAGLAAALSAADEHTGHIDGLARVLAEAADWYESLKMAGTTIAHLRDAATALTAGSGHLSTAGEQLQAAAADFAARDGQVADTIAETGNLMNADGYSETFSVNGAPAAGPAAAGDRHHPPAEQETPMADFYRQPGQAPTSAHHPGGKSMTSTSTSNGTGSAPRRRGPGTDPLKLADRMALLDGEEFAGSAVVKNEEGMLVLAAAVDTPAGRQVHLGVPVYDDEDKKKWRGGHAPAQDTEVDEEDGEEYHVDTGADDTVILDAADAARLPELAADVVARATAVDREYQALIKDSDRLSAARARLEAKRFGSDAEGQRKMDADAKLQHDEYFQRYRRRNMDAAVDRLPPEDRARYNDLQRQIDEAGTDAWEPGKEAEAATVCGLGVDEFTELRTLSRIPWQQRTKAQAARHDALKYGASSDSLHPTLPPLLAEQAAIVCGLTLQEYREMEALERIPKAHRSDYFNRGRRVRTPQEQARLDELDTSPRGATGPTDRKTYKLRASFLSGQRTHHSSKFDTAEAREQQAEIDATARPLAPGEAVDLQRITADLDAVTTRMDALGGWTSATAEIPARNGGALVLEAMQKDEYGGVDYRVGRKPADADDEWSPGANGDPYTTTAGGLRKVAKLVATLAAGT